MMTRFAAVVNYSTIVAKLLIVDTWNSGQVIKALDSQSKGLRFKATGWLQGRLNLSRLIK